MKFKREELIERVTTERNKRIEASKKLNEKYAANFEKSLRDEQTAWIQFADVILDSVERTPAGEYWSPLRADVPELLMANGNRYISIPDQRSARPSEHTPNVHDLNVFLEMLNACADTYVTLAEIRNSGFTQVARLFQVSDASEE